MEAKQNSKIKSGKKRRWLLIFIPVLIAVIIALAIFVFPWYLSSADGQKLILTKVNNSINGKINFENLSVGWFKGITIQDFSFKDNSGEISVQANEISTKPHYGSLIMGNLSFGQTTIDKPQVEINLKEAQEQKTKVVPEAKSASSTPMLIPQEMNLDVKDGSLTITDPKFKTVEVTNINSKVDLRPPGQKSSFELFLAVDGTEKPSTVQADGTVQPPKTGWSLKGTSGDMAVEVNDLNLDSLGPFLALAGVQLQTKGVVRGNMKSDISDGKLKNLTGNINAQNLDITGAELKGDSLRTKKLNVDVKLNQSDDKIDINNLQMQSDWATVDASGVVPTTAESFGNFLKPDSGYSLKGTFDCNLPAVMSQLPNTLGLKKGMQITSGRLNGNIQTVTQAGQKQIQARATLADLGGILDGKPVALSAPLDAEARISTDQKGIRFDQLGLSTPFAKINCSGDIQMLKYNAEADLAKLQSEMGQFVDTGKYQMAGRFQGSGDVSILPEKITTSGSSKINDLKLTSPEGLTASEPGVDFEYAVDFDRKQNVVDISSAKTSAGFGQISVKDGVIPLSSEAAKPMSLLVDVTDFDLAKIRPFAIMFASFPAKMQIAGIAESQISLNSINKIYDISSQSTKIENLKVTYPEQQPFDASQVSLTFDTEIDAAQKMINIKTFTLDSPQIKITKSQVKQYSKGDKTILEGQTDLEYDWTAINTIAAPYLPKGLTIEGKRQDSISFESEYPTGQTDKILANLSADAAVGFQRADYMGLNFGATEVDIQVDKGLLKVEPFTTEVNNGRINFSAEADFKQASPSLTTLQPISIQAVQINEAVTRNLLFYINPIFANAVGASGVANFTAQKLVIPLTNIDQNDIQVVGNIGIDNMQLNPTGFLNQLISLINVRNPRATMRLHPTNFSLQKGYVHYDNMQIDIDNTPINFKGTIGLNKKLDMMVALRISSLAQKYGLGSSLGSVIWIPLTGTIDKPKLDTSKLLESQIPELLKGLGDILK